MLKGSDSCDTSLATSKLLHRWAATTDYSIASGEAISLSVFVFLVAENFSELSIAAVKIEPLVFIILFSKESSNCGKFFYASVLDVFFESSNVFIKNYSAFSFSSSVYLLENRFYVKLKFWICLSNSFWAFFKMSNSSSFNWIISLLEVISF